MSYTGEKTGKSKTSVIFFDDFKDGELDRTKWNVRTTGDIYNDEQQAYVDSPETIYVASAEDIPDVSHGALVIQPRYQPGSLTTKGVPLDFISGKIDTKDKFDFKYGTAAARIKLPSGSGLWTAFWLMGDGTWPDIGEIDVMECVGESDWVGAALHGPGYFGETGLANKFFFSTISNATAWHIYSVDWSPDQIVFRVDGLTIYRVTRPMTEFFGDWVFDNNKYLILNLALGGTYPFKTNGIRSPYYGIPKQTVEMIMNNQVKFMVDWVQVSRKESDGRNSLER